MNPAPIAAWETQKGGLILEMPSQSGNGSYLVAIGYNQSKSKIIIAHSCPAVKKGKKCWHEIEALKYFREWMWWENEVGTISLVRENVLSPEWKQIPLPGTEREVLDHVNIA